MTNLTPPRLTPNMNKPTVNDMPPAIVIGSRHSGTGMLSAMRISLSLSFYQPSLLLTVGCQFLVISRNVDDNQDQANADAHNHAKIWQTCYAKAEAIDLRKDNAVSCQAQVQQSVQETHIDCNEQHDRFGEKNAHWTRHVLDSEFLEVNFDFLLLCVDTALWLVEVGYQDKLSLTPSCVSIGAIRKLC